MLNTTQNLLDIPVYEIVKLNQKFVNLKKMTERAKVSKMRISMKIAYQSAVLSDRLEESIITSEDENITC